MKLRVKSRWIIVTIGLVGATIAGWFEPTGVARGWLRGEAFYEGRPTNYWSRELARWEYSDSVFSLLVAILNENNFDVVRATRPAARVEGDGPIVVVDLVAADSLRFSLVGCNNLSCDPRRLPPHSRIGRQGPWPVRRACGFG